MKAEDAADSVVTATAGRHEGRTGYCDDIEGGDCYVYFGSWGDGYHIVKSKHLRPARKDEEARYRRTYQSTPDRWMAKTANLGH